MWDRRKHGTSLSDLFGPYIPIFMPWVDIWVLNPTNRYHYPAGMMEALKRVLRPGVPYITVSQNDHGLLARSSIKMADIPNVLVLSAGGYGHVPVPLLMRLEAPRISLIQ